MKEFYRSKLPHYQQPGQVYFVTWNLKDAIPKKVISEYQDLVYQSKKELDEALIKNATHTKIEELKHKYHFYRKKMMHAYEDILHQNYTTIDLSDLSITDIIVNAIRFWEKNKIINIALCVMPNHVHWVFKTHQFDSEGNEVWLQNILKSVKNISAKNINLYLGRRGILWNKESWDTTIRSEKHLSLVVDYLIYNPVKAGLVKDWRNWRGTFLFNN
jgi:REP element-mobilizing transposase RayT